MGKMATKNGIDKPIPKRIVTKIQDRTMSALSSPDYDSDKNFDNQLTRSIPDSLQTININNPLLNFEHSPTIPWHELNFVSDPNSLASNNTFLPTSALMALEDSVNLMSTWGTTEQNELGRVTTSSSDTLSSQSPESSPCPSPGLPQPRHPHYPGHSRKESCTNLASATLQSLHLPQSSCQSNPTSAPNGFSPTSSIDQVLETNRKAIQAFHRLLQCPCSSNSTMVLALSLIILRILSSYTAIGRNTLARPTGSTVTDHTPSSSTTWEDDRGMVMDTPISMGAYQIDVEDEIHLKLQLVTNELRKLSKLIDSFQGRYCRNLPSGDGIYGALERFLRTELKCASRELNNALKNSEDM